jgi:hypothetical protein
MATRDNSSQHSLGMIVACAADSAAGWAAEDDDAGGRRCVAPRPDASANAATSTEQPLGWPGRAPNIAIHKATVSSREFADASVDGRISARAFGHTAAAADNAPADGCLEMAYIPAPPPR